jgi:hypothetical protein
MKARLKFVHIFDVFLSFELIQPKVIFATKMNVWATNKANGVDFKPVKKVKKSQ